ncbi:MAG: sulfurtransferase complex subunit TusB [Betaproteobacteria bacterium]|jgi:tRNA 2-thiouridine synthesizing protein B|nr:sulfurtransferase complex subunit TusB [Betaproteobacteria bacterium]MDH4325078.1 sulfurtransferase complex subunit TusB [Betaproteobacteria bacterium]MDH5211685.1 sulfurtransferase complex subunit TusB [Betaproteobacteria bacterium]
MLHTVNKSPFEHKALETCLRFARQGSAVLLIEDGVYAAARDTAVAKDVQEALKRVQVYALKPDVEARGMQNRVMDGVRLVDYGGFVDLVVEHNAVQSWL